VDVRRIVDAPPAARVGDREPFVADECHERPALADRFVDGLGEVHARLHGQVHEDPLRAEVLGELVVEPSGVSRRLPTPVADEDPGRLRVPALLRVALHGDQPAASRR
jgi:hypothetical protein